MWKAGRTRQISCHSHIPGNKFSACVVAKEDDRTIFAGCHVCSVGKNETMMYHELFVACCTT